MGERKNLEELQKQPSKIEELIPKYGEQNDLAKELKKNLADLGTVIKDLMKDFAGDTYIAGGYKAKYSIRKSESFNEDAFIHALNNTPELRHEADSLGLIKLKEYIDMDELESVIYHNQASDFLIDEIKLRTEIKETPTLTITKIKEKK